MGQRTGSRVGQRTRSSGAARTDTRDAPRMPPRSLALVMERARMEGPPPLVLLWLAMNKASCRMRWPHRGPTITQCPGEMWDFGLLQTIHELPETAKYFALLCTSSPRSRSSFGETSWLEHFSEA